MSNLPLPIRTINNASFDEPKIVDKPAFAFQNPLRAEYLPFFRVDQGPSTSDENQPRIPDEALAAKSIPIRGGPYKNPKYRYVDSQNAQHYVSFGNVLSPPEFAAMPPRTAP